MAIGILDSGVGGLTVWQAIATLLPEVSTVYVGDSKNCPYGTKTEEEIWELTQKLVEFLLAKNVTAIVVACNTISVTTLEKLRAKYPEIPFIGTVPAIKTAVAHSKSRRIGILSTPRTAQSAYQQVLIKQFAPDCLVTNLGTGKLVPLVERDELAGDVIKQMLEEVLQPFKEAEIDVLVLGCTHFPFLKGGMQAILGNDVLILDSGLAIARQVQRVLEGQSVSSSVTQTTHQFFTSGEPAQMNTLLNQLHHSTLLTSALPLL